MNNIYHVKLKQQLLIRKIYLLSTCNDRTLKILSAFYSNYENWKRLNTSACIRLATEGYWIRYAFIKTNGKKVTAMNFKKLGNKIIRNKGE